MLNSDRFFKTAITVDNVIFGFDNDDLKILLIKRGVAPFDGSWALPGYFVKDNEELETAANRVLAELTGLENVYLEQVSSYGSPFRHPEGRVVTIAYYSLIKISDFKINASSFASSAEWKSTSQVANLAFDHDQIFQDCLNRLKQKLKSKPIGFELLPSKFTLTELQHLYETVLELDLDKRNFRKKILGMDLLVDLGEFQEGVAHRPARMYKFDKKKYEEFVSKGYVFDISETKKHLKKNPDQL